MADVVSEDSHHQNPAPGVAGGDQNSDHAGHDHGAMIADFKGRFWVSVALTIPVLILLPMIQELLGLRETLAFSGSVYLLLNSRGDCFLLWRMAIPYRHDRRIA